jgi:hypothetical protein
MQVGLRASPAGRAAGDDLAHDRAVLLFAAGPDSLCRAAQRGEWRARGAVRLDREFEAIDRIGLSPTELRILLSLRSDSQPLHRECAAEF